MAPKLLVGQDLLFIEASFHTQCTSQSVGFVGKTDRPDAETCTWKQNTHNRQIYIPPAGFEPADPTSERSQTHALDRVVGVMKI